MAHILYRENPVQEYKRLLGQARHCRDLAGTCENERLNQDLAFLAASYEAKAALVLRATR